MDHKQLDRQKNQQGIFIVFCIILLPSMILILTLIIDLGFLLIANRQAQNLSDMIASASTNLLRKDDPSDVTTVPFLGWQNIKPTAKGLAMLVPVKGAPTPNNTTDWFDDGDTTSNDKTDFGTDQMTVTSPEGQMLNIKIRRELRCYLDGTGEEKTLDLEPYQPYWCLANMARVNVSVSGLSAFFAKFMGVSTLSSLNRESVAHVRPFPLSCGKPSCTLYAPYIDVNASPMAPVATPNCPTPTATPPGTVVPPTATPTPTVGVPTATPTPSANTPTHTPIPPTPTPTSVAPTPTPTPIPPTATPTSIPPTATSTPNAPTATPTWTPTSGGVRTVGPGDMGGIGF